MGPFDDHGFVHCRSPGHKRFQLASADNYVANHQKIVCVTNIHTYSIHIPMSVHREVHVPVACMDACMRGWMDAPMDGCTWMDGRMDVDSFTCVGRCACMHVNVCRALTTPVSEIHASVV